jgi:hypothetical protein
VVCGLCRTRGVAGWRYCAWEEHVPKFPTGVLGHDPQTPAGMLGHDPLLELEYQVHDPDVSTGAMGS